MKPTKDNIVVGFESVNFISTPDDETKKQILDDYEKARKCDETLAHGLFETGHVTLKDYTSALKLRELIEKRIEELKEIAKDHFNARDITSERETDQIIEELQKLLEDSKK